MTKYEHYVSPDQVLGFIREKVAFGALIGDTGVTADANGHKMIPAGTPVGGDTSMLDDENAVLTVATDATKGTVQGILEFPVDVTAGTADGTVIDNGYINRLRLPEDVTISKDMEKALHDKTNGGKVIFISRNK
ncbi:hypothetical protein CT113_03680 [Levilactobacillus brevis]|uniref:hypothetical protein n=1 Tax=Levilactobacillus brevis TaxID=1580 RepID=UPI000411979A|nr:hypothetical protein [Levilactobacillus brevis]ATU69488.1 hypothetical protein CT113_03680 [Levilactobacillus brevis]KID42938.1 hypothetical protein LbDm2_2170 [Levilactobacillus brevis]